MKIGLDSTATNTGTIDNALDDARAAADAGLASFWVPNFFGLDALLHRRNPDDIPTREQR